MGKVHWRPIEPKNFCKHPGCKDCTNRCRYNDNFAMTKLAASYCKSDKLACNNSK